jgi:hypothetical protein
MCCLHACVPGRLRRDSRSRRHVLQPTPSYPCTRTARHGAVPRTCAQHDTLHIRIRQQCTPATFAGPAGRMRHQALQPTPPRTCAPIYWSARTSLLPLLQHKGERRRHEQGCTSMPAALLVCANLAAASPLVCLSTRLPLHWSLPSSAHRSGLRARPHAVPAARHCLAAGARLGRRAGSHGAPRRRIGWRGASHDGGWGGSGRHLDQHAVAVADQGEAPVKHVRVGDVELLLRHPDIRVLQRQQRLPPPRPSLQPATRSAS